MKENVDKHQGELTYSEEDCVYMKLQPYIQTTLTDKKNKKKTL